MVVGLETTGTVRGSVEKAGGGELGGVEKTQVNELSSPPFQRVVCHVAKE